MTRFPILALLVAVAAPGAQAQRTNAAGLETLFKEWRAFQPPKRVAGVYDYRVAAMAAQKKELETYQQRLKAIDPTGCPIPAQVDYHIVRAEMNGLEFDHRVLEPLKNNP